MKAAAKKQLLLAMLALTPWVLLWYWVVCPHALHTLCVTVMQMVEIMLLHYHQLFSLYLRMFSTSLPGPLPAVDPNEDREPSVFAYECAPCGWLMEWDLVTREQQLYVWAHHRSLDLYPVAGGDTAGHKQRKNNL